ncbi:type I-E CRISPR-associated protein Cse2/CasB [Endozoicomonas sp. G2_2]|uniref:type I-E CRISPR-associated protein Cse2/CasB n=1 Tax=Endozoicomonas sp. G2_2 TaxID=2821092 RepID=UPI001ADACED4|nr:type I-E CRISPR-associated protein Cse2/CasB [Endozoicomonas sp. G2_2]MBO9468773.1 type I-E CRISPR-associated protein Cse2/CasB [Endozoicomonas sp. G2_2]
MSSHAQAFIDYLQQLREVDRGAIAALRHSAAFELGRDPSVFPYVEDFAGKNRASDDPYRLALYEAAALYARHPAHRPVTFASAFGALRRERDNPSIEQRFVTLLAADKEQVFPRLRQAVDLLAADDYGLNYVQLISDLADWLAYDANALRKRRLCQTWGRDFYRAALSDQAQHRQTGPEAFVDYLEGLARDKSNASAMARLRRSLTYPPGEDPQVFALVEPFIDPDWSHADSRRRARYLLAGLFAMHPEHYPGRRFASALNRLARQHTADSEGIERRFIALLGASPDTVDGHLRQAMFRLQDTQIGYDAIQLLKDLSVWIRRTPNIAQLDRLRQQWARDFYWIPRADEPTSQPKQTEGA